MLFPVDLIRVDQQRCHLLPCSLVYLVEQQDRLGGALAQALETQRPVESRDRWLNPPEWVEWIDEPGPGYQKRPIPESAHEAHAYEPL